MTVNAVLNSIGNIARAVLDFRLFDLGDKPVTVSTLMTVLIVITISFWISRLVQRALLKQLEERGVANEGAVAVGGRLAHYAIVLMGLGVGLQTAGVDLSALFAAGAVFAIAIGFAVQNVAQNFVSGVILLVEGAIKPGDVLQVGDKVVRVSQMGIRSTVATTMDNTEVILPNSELVSSSVYNYTMSDKLVRVRIDVGVEYASDPTQVVAVLAKTAEDFADKAPERAPIVLFKDFGASSLDFQVSIWTKDPWRIPLISTALRLAMWDALKDAGIVIAFPQLDVHLDRDVVERIGRPAA